MGLTNYKYVRATGAAAIAETIAVDGGLVIIEVRLHLDAVGGAAESFTVTIDSGVSAVYDTVLASQDMNALADYVWRPAKPVPISDGDEIDFAWANTGTKTWGLAVIYRDDV